ncbi:MAG TPA: hypothetical protein VFQ72_03200 [Candidatus Paceibacterota bacterium]|nr:hypothetical protein [Candidatus Paceibacterota bacterium]
MQIKIKVVSHEGQLWFELDDLKFDALDAFLELYGMNVHVIRDGVIIAKGLVSDARGEPVFKDYSTRNTPKLRGSPLLPEEFCHGDQLALDVPDKFNFVNHLIESCRFQDALIASMPIGQKMDLIEAKSKITAELEKTSSDVPPRILRFRRGK